MKAFAALGLVLPLVAAKVSYNGYKAFHLEDLEDYEEVQSHISQLNYISLSCESNHQGMDIAVAPESIEDFEALGLNATVVHEDFGADIAQEGSFKPYVSMSSVMSEGEAAALPDPAYFKSYHELEAHEAFLKDLQAAFPQNSKLFTVGKSVEGRDIQGIHVWGASGPGKKAIVWHGTVHAREWISGVTVEYLAYKLIEGYQKKSATVVKTLDNHDFYIMPVVNPDGFVYSTTNDRMWRKNRQKRAGKSCVGTDVNRNWPWQWDVPGGSSPDPCDQTYRGEAAGDTPEMKALTAHLSGLRDTTGIKWFVDWHAFSQLILLPYGYDCNKKAANIDHQMKLAGGVAAAIQGTNGLKFVYGPTCKTIYKASGGSMDWGYDVGKAELSWAYELRPSSNGAGGFILPPSNIVPSGEENWAGVEWLFANF